MFHCHSFNVSKNCELSAKLTDTVDVWWVYLYSLSSLLSIHIGIDTSKRHIVCFGGYEKCLSRLRSGALHSLIVLPSRCDIVKNNLLFLSVDG
jgi:hypothetical protein